MPIFRKLFEENENQINFVEFLNSFPELEHLSFLIKCYESFFHTEKSKFAYIPKSISYL
jgi:hypothetical protein